MNEYSEAISIATEARSIAQHAHKRLDDQAAHWDAVESKLEELLAWMNKQKGVQQANAVYVALAAALGSGIVSGLINYLTK